MKAIRMLSVFIIISMLTLWLKSDSTVADTRDIALVLKVAGKAECRSTGYDWSQLKKATRLKAGDKIRTGKESLVAMVFTDDKSMLRIRSDSEVEIGGKRTNKGFTKRLYMGLGDMWAKINPKGAGFRLETPSGVAAVKGTNLYSKVYADSTLLWVIEGLVELLSPHGNVEVGQGQKGTLFKTKAPLVVADVKDDLWTGEKEPGDILEIEFEDNQGNKKTLQMKYEPKQ